MIRTNGYIVLDMPNEEYHESPALSKSKLSEFDISPEHYFDKYEAPDRERSQKTKAFDMGNAIHCAILEPDFFDNRYLVIPKIDKRYAQGKEDYKIFCEMAEAEDKTLIEEGDAAKCWTIRKRIQEHPTIGPVLRRAKMRETSFFCKDTETGIDCRARIDALDFDNGLMIDAKSARDVDDIKFEYAIEEYRYHFQFPFYNNVIETVTGIEMKAFIYVAIEKTRPFGIRLYTPDQVAINAGDGHVRDLMRRFAECRATGIWPGYNPDIKMIGLPRRLLLQYGIKNPYGM